METVSEKIFAKSRDEAFERIDSLYPNAGYLLLSRRDSDGQFSSHGHYFTFLVQYEYEPEEDYYDFPELGEEEMY